MVTGCEAYTGIHAKPKPKFKTGAISESTTALNVGQPNNETPAAIPSSVADINRVITATEQIANVPVAAAAGSASVATTTQKREAGLAKVQADKKKMLPKAPRIFPKLSRYKQLNAFPILAEILSFKPNG
uniref:Uncharacterized protein n=1 Tax=Brassica campestris TaxID=3711 RepID=M4CXY8_BRACM